MAAFAALVLACWLPLPWPGAARAEPAAGLHVEVLDVGQGDAILLRPADAPAVLVDGGPPGDGLSRKLSEIGVDRLGAAIVTHDQADHAGGLEELLGSLPVERFLFARVHRGLLARAVAAGADPQRLAAGSELRSGGLRLHVLWPPPGMLATPLLDQDPNQQALVADYVRKQDWNARRPAA